MAASNKVGVMQRKLSRKYHLSQRTVGRHLKAMGVRYYRRQEVPKYTQKQITEVSQTAWRLLRHHLKPGISIIIDDEKYFEYGCDEIPGNAGYYTADNSTVPADVKYKAEEKYPPKILVWIVISDRGISEPLFRPSKAAAIDQHVYRLECLEQRLLPFIEIHHLDGNYIFWPDKASSHYTKSVLD